MLGTITLSHRVDPPCLIYLKTHVEWKFYTCIYCFILFSLLEIGSKMQQELLSQYVLPISFEDTIMKDYIQI